MTNRPVLEEARRLADDLLFPGALDVDAADLVPRSRLDALAGAGLYGLSGPSDAGGLAADSATATRVVETLAGGCLSTTFVWLQHQGVLRRIDESTGAARDRWLAPMCRGDLRSGVAIAGIRPGGDPLRARQVEDGWLLDGVVPWVTGWGRIDVVHVAALDDDGAVVWLLVDARGSASLLVERQRLVAVDASGTVTLRFTRHRTPGERLTSRTSYDDWQAADVAALRGNGSLSLGVAGRCARLLPAQDLADALVAEVEGVRDRLDGADADAMPAARAAASELAWRAAGLLVVGCGSRAVLRHQHAQRLAREAMFLLVFGSRPPIKTELLRALSR
ncbi:MAG: acyl-CoA dehydrogenase family protein [Actinomycetes bacterium]